MSGNERFFMELERHVGICVIDFKEDRSNAASLDIPVVALNRGAGRLIPLRMGGVKTQTLSSGLDIAQHHLDCISFLVGGKKYQ
jgi:hypothetical protein